jgi:hypothetical protein
MNQNDYDKIVDEICKKVVEKKYECRILINCEHKRWSWENSCNLCGIKNMDCIHIKK